METRIDDEWRLKTLRFMAKAMAPMTPGRCTLKTVDETTRESVMPTLSFELTVRKGLIRVTLPEKEGLENVRGLRVVAAGSEDTVVELEGDCAQHSLMAVARAVADGIIDEGAGVECMKHIEAWKAKDADDAEQRRRVEEAFRLKGRSGNVLPLRPKDPPKEK